MRGAHRAKYRAHFFVVLWHEAADREFALDHHGEGRGLDPPHRQHLPRVRLSQGVEPREIHSDEPIRLTAPARCVSQPVELAARAQVRKPLGDGLIGERGNPESLHRFVRTRRFVDEAEDQLAFAARVRRAYDALGVLRAEDPLDDIELVAGLVVDTDWPRTGNHRKLVQVPALPTRFDFVRLRERGQMSDGPGHDVAIA